ncbi:hypothetical protein [Nocardioides marmorisolisilvae]|uniref:Uncharacterized protein n=1 Tax=Nocardioides marmorisolisilvae TaxID=1542737 RepID=A0A3N0DP93_9ACTN|nr:hypothetical protein [Nocardioides marmorisolisilvae]RNL77276.1 hypothetical protein EFL95_17590 [Nocardioides marmorisolisilvae]
MTTRSQQRSRRRIATFVAALGTLVMGSGVVLLAAAPAANADKTPVNICHATSSDSNPYTFITVDNDSVKLQGHLKHRNDPNKRWKSDGTFNGVAHTKGQPKPDIIGDYTDPEGNLVVLDGVVNSETCGNQDVPPPVETTASATFVDPSCANDNSPSYSTEGDHVTFALEGTVAPGESVTVTATVDDGYTFADDAQELQFDHTFSDAADCTVTPPTEPKPPVVATPTVVHAGLIGTPVTVSDLRTEQGMALLASGLLLMVAAAGLARPRGARR